MSWSQTQCEKIAASVISHDEHAQRLEAMSGEWADAKATRDERHESLMEAIRETESGAGSSWSADATKRITKLHRDYERALSAFVELDRSKRSLTDTMKKLAERTLTLVREALEGPDLFAGDEKHKPRAEVIASVALADVVGPLFAERLAEAGVVTIGEFLEAAEAGVLEKDVVDGLLDSVGAYLERREMGHMMPAGWEPAGGKKKSKKKREKKPAPTATESAPKTMAEALPKGLMNRLRKNGLDHPETLKTYLRAGGSLIKIGFGWSDIEKLEKWAKDRDSELCELLGGGQEEEENEPEPADPDRPAELGRNISDTGTDEDCVTDGFPARAVNPLLKANIVDEQDLAVFIEEHGYESWKAIEGIGLVSHVAIAQWCRTNKRFKKFLAEHGKGTKAAARA